MDGVRWLAGSLLVACLGGCALLRPTPAADVPDRLRPGSDEVLVRVVPARGVQIYECRPRQDPAAGYEWALVAPEAELFDARGQRIGRHFVGPHWEAEDGSRIVGRVTERAEAPAAGAIAWLLLTTRSVGAEGAFSKVTSVQRVHTAGGVAPRTGCSAAQAGASARVPYTADYYFYSVR